MIRSLRHPVWLLASLLLALLVPAAALAHDESGGGVINGPPGHDKPGPPPILTTVTLVWVDYPYELWGDDWGSYAEINISPYIQHQGHGDGHKAISNLYLDWDGTGSWLIFEDIYSHRECTPMEPLTLNLSGFEADASKLDEVETRLLKLLVELANTDKFILPKSEIVKIITKLLAFLNPDDYLGFGLVVAPAPGSYEVTTAGGDYVIKGLFDVSAPIQTGGECDPDSIPYGNDPPPPYCHYSTAYFDTLADAYGDVDEIQLEPGAEARFNPQDLDDARSALRSAIVGMAQWAAAQMLEKAQGLSGFFSSYYYYLQAMNESAPQCIADFKTAFCNAEFAINNNVPDPSAPQFANHAFAVPQMIATRAGRPAEYLIGVFGAGADGIGIASVTGGPPGATFTLAPVDPAHPAWRELHVDENGPPGTYTITVTFTGGAIAGPQDAIPPLTLTLDLDEPTVVTDAGPKPPRSLPAAFVLHGVRPNPVVSLGALRVDLPTRSTVSLSIYDVAGRRVQELLRGQTMDAGSVVLRVDATGLSPGVYHARLQAIPVEGDRRLFQATTKLIVSH